MSQKFYSQNEETCGRDVDAACGVVSLANALILLEAPHHKSPEQIIQALSSLSDKSLAEMKGISPVEMLQLCNTVGRSMGYQAVLEHPCAMSRLSVGTIMYVDSIALKNCQGDIQFESAAFDSHIVTVESINATEIVLISPDCRRSGRGFRHDIWGRMKLRVTQLDEVWKTTRQDGLKTEKAAVFLSRIAD